MGEGAVYREESTLIAFPVCIPLTDTLFHLPAVLAKCARGEHDPGYKYGVFGILVGLVCCPCGFALTLYVAIITTNSADAY